MDIKEEIYNHFQNDKLFKYLKKNGFADNQLYPTFLAYINFEHTYSTTEVANLCDTTDNLLRYYLKIMISIDYIKDDRTGRNYRLDYLQIYKMFLVVKTLSIENINTNDVKDILTKEHHSANFDENVLETPKHVIDYKKVTEYDKQIILKQYEITIETQRLNEAYRKFLHFESKFNLAVLENEYANQLNVIMKQQTKKNWFSRSNIDYETVEIDDANNNIMDLKEQLNAIHTNISDHKSSLSQKMNELHQLIEEKMELLND